ncbi:MAG: Uma2 family endonuclease [Nostoc sp. NOS(2021)]|uniref:Uma2 family endonuclease n=1 Tax=Nostoc sp. NOS(2021) TaxID=2815407 RepID=UPI0025DB3308|nr:Uma2 family endonuclease [Nostoc sp. NOS(2021)]MBN3898505.1 Uma2 family endonuclease [Nostoc sp. NOS(2021)]
MTLSIQPTTALSVEEFLILPETKPASEYFNGQISQKAMPQGKHSTLQIELASAINQITKPQKLAYAFPELRCTFQGCSIVPDIAVFEWQRIPLDGKGSITNKFEIPPDWIIEILSPVRASRSRRVQSPNRVIRKITFSIQNGAKLGWLLDPDDESIMIFEPNKLPELKEKQDVLPVLSVLENWQLTVADVFSWLSFV